MLDLNRQVIRNCPSVAYEGVVNREILKWCGFFALVALFVGWSIYLRNQILLVQYEIEEVTRENAKVLEQNQLLRAQFKALVSPGQVEEEARKLGMINLNQPGVVVLEGDRFGGPVRTYAQSRPGPKVMHE